VVFGHLQFFQQPDLFDAMHGAALWALLTVGAAARGVPGRNLHGRSTPEYQFLSQDEALSKLSAKAEATPSAVQFLPGVPLSLDQNGVVHM
jgi:hypothetical protein